MIYHSWEEVPLMLTVRELAAVLRVSRNTAYDIVRSGQISSKRAGDQIRIPKKSLEKYLNAA